MTVGTFSGSRPLRALSLGVRLAAGRLATRPAMLVALLGLSLAVTSGLIERDFSRVGAADRTVASIARLVVPLASFALVTLATGRRRLNDALWCAARFGAPRRHLALGFTLATALAAALLSLLAVQLGLAASYAGSGAWLGDAWTSGWVVVLAATAYTSLFVCAATFWPHGRARWLALLGDFLLGSGDGALACAWPRAHLRSLVGGAPVLDLPQASSSVMLALMAVLFGALAMARAGD